MVTTQTKSIPRIQPNATDDYYMIGNAAASAAARWNSSLECFEELPGVVEIDMSCGTGYSGEYGLAPTMSGELEQELEPFGVFEARVLLRMTGFRWDGSSPIYTYEVHRIIR